MTETQPTIRFKSSRFGDLEIPEEKVIRVPDGIIGFQEFKRYVLLDPTGGESLFLWLHCVDDPDLAFVIADPLAFVPGYRIDSSEPDIDRLNVAQKPAPALFVIVTVPPDDPDKINANLIAPLLYFESDNSLYQIILENADWPLRYFLLGEGRSDPGATGTDAAPSGGVL